MSTFHNVHAVLVHERQDVVVDLVRNLRRLDPESTILLYNGGRDAALLDRAFAPGGEEPLVHPRPRPLAWGRLHDFALDCMRFALDTLSFDAITIVDSDQLATRPGYSAHLAAHLAGGDGVGMLGNAPGPQPPTTRIGPPAAALKELELWRPFLRRFDGGEEKFPHWTFWPSTVFTAAAARELVDLFARDTRLPELMRRTKIWATEEVILPTLVALLGFEVARSPCSYEFVKYNARYTPRQLASALTRRDVFWIHPVPRRCDDQLRRRIRARFGDYARAPHVAEPSAPSGLLLTSPILRRMKRIEGWLEEDEADLLIATTARALAELPEPHPIVEIGSYCGRSTVVLGSVVRAVGAAARVHAIDPHDGEVGAVDQGLQRTAPTLARFAANVAAADLTDLVETVQQRSYEVRWNRPIGVLLIDGLHDYANVSRDFWHFEKHVVAGGYVAFHDYADYYPGVKALVHEVLATGRYRRVHLARSLMVVQKTAAAPQIVRTPARPLVSCVLPTFDRPAFAAHAVELFLRQDHEPRELIVVDDGTQSVAPLLPSDERIRHLRVDGRRTIGAKRNLGCAAARGELLANWDDDDWMSPRRLSVQVDALTRTDAEVCGLNRILYYEPATDRAWRYVYPWDSAKWASDGTLLYTRAFWSGNPFPDTSGGIDLRFLRAGRVRKLVPLDDESVYVGMIHPANTSRKHTRQSVWRPIPSERIHELLGGDLAVYARVFMRSDKGSPERALQNGAKPS
jgi:Methyltransferase domain/Glycosyl transferase family 2